jgi:hypothetical protein
VDRGFLGRHEAGAHVHTIGAQRQRGHELARIADAA